jgi:hypothetical protein
MPGPAPAPAPGPRCSCCGEPVGVYEPLVAIERGRARQTSRAAEPAIATTPGEYRHLACHAHRAQPRSQAPRELREESALAGDPAAAASGTLD